jgi:hypothetical protein
MSHGDLLAMTGCNLATDTAGLAHYRWESTTATAAWQHCAAIFPFVIFSSVFTHKTILYSSLLACAFDAGTAGVREERRPVGVSTGR